MDDMWMLTDMIVCGCKYHAGHADFLILIFDSIAIHFWSIWTTQLSSFDLKIDNFEPNEWPRKVLN